MKDALVLALGLAGLYVALTWSYAGYRGWPREFEDSTADRLEKSRHVSAAI